MVAEGVVDLLEVIEVDEDHAGMRLVARGHRDRLLQTVHQQHPVGQVGERIEMRHVPDLVLGGPAGGDIHKGGDRAVHLALRVTQRRGVADQVLDRSVVEHHVLLEIAHLDATRGGHLHGQLVGRQRAAVAIHGEVRGALVIRRRERDVAALGQTQQIVGGPVAGDDLAFGIVRDPHRRGHRVEHRFQLGGALALLALAFHERALDPFAFADVVGHHDHAHDFAVLDDR